MLFGLRLLLSLEVSLERSTVGVEPTVGLPSRYSGTRVSDWLSLALEYVDTTKFSTLNTI